MIEAMNLSFSYPNGVAALRNVSFRLEDGKKYALVGSNGAGKSTLLSLLCALDFPQSGTAHVGGIPLKPAEARRIRGQVGMVFQNPDDQLFMPTVYDDIAFGLRNRNLPEAEVETQVNAIMEAMAVAHLKNRPPYRLSGGEKRSAALAAVLVMKPHVLLMDEPTAFLDPRARRSLLRLLQSLDVGMLIATHDLALAEEMADGILILKGGELLAQGSSEILRDVRLLEEAELV
ncbi:MAG TPA: ABC transporter ATP-binding protein [Clostridia bacterium]|nr:ABC transporter ATP-binding protein [Clostridia bacterium]